MFRHCLPRLLRALPKAMTIGHSFRLRHEIRFQSRKSLIVLFGGKGEVVAVTDTFFVIDTA